MKNKPTQNPIDLDAFCTDKLAQLESNHSRRYLVPTARQAEALAQRGAAKQSVLSFSCNDYLGLSHHPEVIEAAQQAAQEFGVGAGASRLITGNHPLFMQLETLLAEIKQTEDCLVFGSGYLANIGIIPAFIGTKDLLLVDELAHACINAGGQLSGAKIIRFQHNDMQDLAHCLETHRQHYEKCLIVTDGVFSMDGDLAPLADMRQLADQHHAWLMSDDAHGIGVVGHGMGSAHAFEPPVQIELQMGTLSKAVGGYGGYVCASHAVCEFLRNRARSLVFSTGLPPMSVAAAIAALKIIQRNPELCATPTQLAALFCEKLDLPAPQSPIVPVIFKTNAATLAASEALLEAGFLVSAIRPPTVPENTARLRVAFNATHKKEDILSLADHIQKLQNELMP
ncbi:MAG: 8-amino-7-oxononanoate synthase [Parvibaculales bacterium]